MRQAAIRVVAGENRRKTISFLNGRRIREQKHNTNSQREHVLTTDGRAVEPGDSA